jgi:hypothetical protein
VYHDQGKLRARLTGVYGRHVTPPHLLIKFCATSFPRSTSTTTRHSSPSTRRATPIESPYVTTDCSSPHSPQRRFASSVTLVASETLKDSFARPAAFRAAARQRRVGILSSHRSACACAFTSAPAAACGRARQRDFCSLAVLQVQAPSRLSVSHFL